MILAPGGLGAAAREPGTPASPSGAGVRHLAARLVVAQPLALAALFLVGLGPRLWDLGRASFSLDELTSLAIVAADFQAARHAVGVETNMSLYYWLLFGWVRLVGVGADEATLRLPAAVIGAAAIPLVYLLGRRLHSTAAGLAAAGLLAMNGFHVAMSQEARGYAVFGTLAIGSFLAVERALRRGGRWDWALHGLINALAFYAHFLAAFMILAQALFVLSRRSRAALLGLCLSGFLTALLVAPLAPVFLRGSSGRGPDPSLTSTPLRFAGLLAQLSGGELVLPLLYLGLAAIGIVWCRREARQGGWLLLTWLLVPLGLVFVVAQVRPFAKARYLFGILPALTLLAGVGLSRLPRALPVALLLLTVASALLTRVLERSAPEDEPWRAAVAYATAAARPGDGWVFVSKWGQHAFEYYAGWHWGRNPSAPYSDMLEPFDWLAVARYSQYRWLSSLDGLEAFAENHPRIWLIQWHEIDPVTRSDRTQQLRSWLERHDYRWRTREFRGIRLRLYQRPAASAGYPEAGSGTVGAES